MTGDGSGAEGEVALSVVLLQLLHTQSDLANVNKTVGTLITWMAQSANSPLSGRDAQQLLDMLPKT